MVVVVHVVVVVIVVVVCVIIVVNIVFVIIVLGKSIHQKRFRIELGTAHVLSPCLKFFKTITIILVCSSRIY